MPSREDTYKRFKDFLSTLTPNQIEEGNAKEHAESVRQHALFSEALKVNRCYICQKPLNVIDRNLPCVHWLLAPTGFRKPDLPIVYERFSYFNIQSFLRWLANADKPAGNINDLANEMDSRKIIDHTIVYNNLEWSFSCSESDFKGHVKSFAGKEPHYHFQMRIHGKSFIRFGDFHIPFTDRDVILIMLQKEQDERFRHTIYYGEGMNTVMTELKPEYIVNDTSPTTDESKGTFRIQTVVEARPGKTINGDMLAKLFEESKEKNVTMASLLHKLDADVRSVITPGPGVPEIAHRSKRKR